MLVGAIDAQPFSAHFEDRLTHAVGAGGQCSGCHGVGKRSFENTIPQREWLEKEVEDICAELGISPTNCGVMLYRARMRLRDCLDRNWFAGQR
jgi:hypothetical protein